MEKTSTRPLAIGLVLLGVLGRLTQNMNFAPVGAVSLFAGARLRGWQAYLLPIALMAVTDPFLHGYSFATPFVYASFLINVWMGSKLRRTEKPAWIGGAAAIGSLQFFLLTNFAVWINPAQAMYPHNFAGLGACFMAAIPFFRNTLLADLMYSAAFFGLYALLTRTVARSERVAATA
jgi:hypothetical protein